MWATSRHALVAGFGGFLEPIVFDDTLRCAMTSREFWEQRWDQNKTAFHEGKPNDLLEAHVARLEDHRENPLRILVPLAGKAEDLRYLAGRGHEVVGVEFVFAAIDAFFRARGLDPQEHHLELGEHDAYRAEGVTLVCADMLGVSPDALGTFDAIYDRAALVAIEPAIRERYVATCRALSNDGAATLLVAFSYEERIEGPPWSVDRAVVDALFADRSIEVLSTRPATVAPGLAAAGVRAVCETAYLIGT